MLTPASVCIPSTHCCRCLNLLLPLPQPTAAAASTCCCRLPLSDAPASRSMLLQKCAEYQTGGGKELNRVSFLTQASKQAVTRAAVVAVLGLAAAAAVAAEVVALPPGSNTCCPGAMLSTSLSHFNTAYPDSTSLNLKP